MTGACPSRFEGKEGRVTLAHAEGGRLTRQWLEQKVIPAVCDGDGASHGDAAHLLCSTSSLRFSTDSFVVTPRFFPGGDIGRLAVFGTANDLAVTGACPKWISLSMILEEGLEMEEVDRILQSVAAAAHEADVRVVTGDTKVVPHGAVDGVFLNTAGIGESHWQLPGCDQLREGDQLLVTGPLGCHGFAVLCAREQLGFDPAPQSDCGALFPAVEMLRQSGVEVRAMRDATRGGVAAVLHEWAAASGMSLRIEKSQIPVTNVVRGVSELLGLDPLYVACEGTMVVAVHHDHVERALAALQRARISQASCRIGEVLARGLTPVMLRGALGRDLPFDEATGTPLPRIC